MQFWMLPMLAGVCSVSNSISLLPNNSNQPFPNYSPWKNILLLFETFQSQLIMGSTVGFDCWNLSGPISNRLFAFWWLMNPGLHNHEGSSYYDRQENMFLVSLQAWHRLNLTSGFCQLLKIWALFSLYFNYTNLVTWQDVTQLLLHDTYIDTIIETSTDLISPACWIQ